MISRLLRYGRESKLTCRRAKLGCGFVIWGGVGGVADHPSLKHSPTFLSLSQNLLQSEVDTFESVTHGSRT